MFALVEFNKALIGFSSWSIYFLICVSLY